MFFVAKEDYSESNHQSSGTVGTVHVCVGVLVVFWIFYPHVMCKRNYSAIFSQNCWVAALCQFMCNSQCVQVFQLTLLPLKLTVK